MTQRKPNQCPECGNEDCAPNPVLEDHYECSRCVIAFDAHGNTYEEV